MQEAGPVVDHLTVFQRTPNLSLPMQQKYFDDEEQAAIKKTMPDVAAKSRETHAAIDYDFDPRSASKPLKQSAMLSLSACGIKADSHSGWEISRTIYSMRRQMRWHMNSGRTRSSPRSKTQSNQSCWLQKSPLIPSEPSGRPFIKTIMR